MSKALIEILGDAASYLRAARQSAGATTSLELDLGKLAVTAQKTADAQVRASITKTARLRAEVTAYHELAASAVKGSQEEVTATNLAADAQKRLARSMSLTADEQGRLGRSSGVHAAIGGSAEKAGSKLAGVAKNAAFLGGSLLAGGGLVYGLKDIVDSGVKAQAETAQLTKAVDDSGQAYGRQKKAIDATLASARALGFAQDESITALSTEERATRNTQVARSALNLAENISRGSGKSLAVVATAVAKAYGGQTGPLRRLVPSIQAGVSATDALAQASKAYAGDAVKYASGAAGAQDRLASSLHEVEVIASSELLPTITSLSTKVANWTDKSKNQATVQRDVKTAVKDVSEVAKVMFGILNDGVSVVKGIDDVTGSFKNTLIATSAVIAGFKIQGMLTSLGSIGTQAGGANTEVSALSRSLGGLKLLGVIGITIAVGFEITKGAQAFSKWLGKNTKGFSLFGAGLGDSPAFQQKDIAKLAAGNDSDATLKWIEKQGGLTSKQLKQIEAIRAKQASALGLMVAGPDGTVYDGKKHAKVQKGAPVATRTVKRKPGQGPSDAQLAQIALEVASARTDASKLTALTDERKAYASKIAAIRAQMKGASGADYTLLQGDLTKLEGQDTAALAKITTIEHKGATARKAAVSKAAAAARAAATAYMQGLETTATGLLSAADASKTVAATRKTFGALIAFYKREADDTHLTRLERAKYAKLAIDEANRMTADIKRDKAAAAKAVTTKQLSSLGIGTGQTISQLLDKVKTAGTAKKEGVTVAANVGVSTVNQLKTETDQVAKALQGTFLDTNVSRNLITKIRKLLSGQLGGLNADMRGKIQQLLTGLTADLSSGVDGFNLTAADKRRRFLDRQYSDTYGKLKTSKNLRALQGGGSMPGVKVGRVTPQKIDYHFSPVMQVIADEPLGHALDRAFFRQKIAFRGA